MQIDQFIDKLEAECRRQGLEEFEIRYGESSGGDIDVFKQEVDRQQERSSRSLTLSVRINGKIGRYHSEELGEDKIGEIVSEAAANARLIETEETFFFFDGKAEYPQVKPYQPDWNALDELDKVQYLKDLERLAYAYNPQVDNVIKCHYGYNRSQSFIRNSLGLNLQHEDGYASAYIYLGAKNGEISKTDSEGVYFSRPEDFKPETIINRVMPRLIARLNVCEVENQKTKVIFDRQAMASFLARISSYFSIYNIDTGRSKYKEKLEQAVASPLVTIWDDPWLENGLETRSFDNEGVPTKRKKLVENGILKGFAYNLAFADKYKTQSTGNGSGGLGVRFFNLYIPNGEGTKEDLFVKLGDGIYIDSLTGLKQGVQQASGDFSVAADGFQIKNGKIVCGLNQFTISGNLYDLLFDIEELAADIDWTEGSVLAPSAIVKNITVAGN